MIRSALLFSILTATAPLAAQAATIVPFGTGCAFLGQTLGITATGLPQLGGSVTLEYVGPNLNNQIQTQPVLGLGLAPAAVPIPAAILPQQPTGCTQWLVPDALLPMAVSAQGNFEDRVAIAIPNAPTLIGFQFHAQWLVIVIQCGFVPPCTLDALPTSDALQLTCGL
jgi:hypothetical protein